MSANFDEFPGLDRQQFIRHNPAFQEKIFGRSGLLPFWVADTDFKVMTELIRALTERAEMGLFGYETPTAALREAIAHWQHSRYGSEVVGQELLFTPSVNTSIAIIINEFSKKGEGVIVQPPVYSAFMSTIKKLSRQVVYNPLIATGHGYRMDFDDLEKQAAKPENKIMILCSPHNPTGRVWQPAELQQVCDICARHDVLLISDEIHLDIVYPPHQFTATLGIYAPLGENIVMVSSAGKSFGIPGLVSSYLFTPSRSIRTTIQKHIQRYHLDKSNAFSNTAIATVYRQGSDWLSSMIAYLQGNIDYVDDFLRNELPAVRFRPPEGTYQLWLDMRGLGMDNHQLSSFLVEEAGLALNPGYSYGPGGDGFARMNIASPRSLIRQGMEQLAAAVKRLPGQAGDGGL